MAYPVSGTPWAGASASPAYTGIFIPALWSGKFIEKFYDATVLNAISNTDYEGEIKNQGDIVKIRTVPDITIRDYEADQALVFERPSSNLVELQVDKGKYFNTVLDDVFEVQADVNLMNVWSDDASSQMKISIDTTVLSSIEAGVVAANKGATAGAISANINLGKATAPVTIDKTTAVEFIVDLGLVLDEQNIPEAGRYLVVPSWFAARIKKSDLKDASLAGDATSILRNGRLGMIDRFTLYQSNLLPKSGVEYTVFAGHKNGLTFASQLTKMETLRAQTTFGTIMRGLQVFGSKVVDGTAIAAGVVTPG